MDSNVSCKLTFITAFYYCICRVEQLHVQLLILYYGASYGVPYGAPCGALYGASYVSVIYF